MLMNMYGMLRNVYLPILSNPKNTQVSDAPACALEGPAGPARLPPGRRCGRCSAGTWTEMWTKLRGV